VVKVKNKSTWVEAQSRLKLMAWDHRYCTLSVLTYMSAGGHNKVKLLSPEPSH